MYLAASLNHSPFDPIPPQPTYLFRTVYLSHPGVKAVHPSFSSKPPCETTSDRRYGQNIDYHRETGKETTLTPLRAYRIVLRAYIG